MTQGDVARFIETGYGAFADLAGAAVDVAQSLNDLYAHPTRRAIATRRACSPSPAQAIDQLREAKRLPLTKLARSCLDRPRPPAPAPVVTVCDRGAGIGRFHRRSFPAALLFETIRAM